MSMTHSLNMPLTDEQVKEIKELYGSGDYSYKNISQLVGCSRSSVYNVIHYDG